MTGDWLPDLLLLEHCNGNWTEYLERLHECFVADFIDGKPVWPGKRVALKRHPEHEGKSATFWHMISEGKTEAERTPDMRRCERIGWPRVVMDEFDEAAPGTTECRILWWKEERDRDQRYLLATDDFSYVVVVADRGDYVLPWTAFLCEHRHQRDKRERAFRRYWDARKG